MNRLTINISLEAKLSLFVSLLIIILLVSIGLFNYWLEDILVALVVSAAIVFPISIVAIHAYMAPINRILSALNDGFHNFLDNDFSISLAKTRHDELGDLVEVYNKVGAVLRDERLNLYQRELLLDTVIQTTPLALILVDDSGAISESFLLAPNQVGLVEIPPRTWHNLVSLESGSVVYEFKPGPFTPVNPNDFAAWAPEEGSRDCQEILNQWRSE